MKNRNSEEQDEIVVRIDATIRDIIPDFLQHRAENVTMLFSALEAGDFDAVRQIGHDIEGSGGAFGFKTMASLGRSLRLAGTDEVHGEVRSLAEELASYIARLKIVYVSRR